MVHTHSARVAALGIAVHKLQAHLSTLRPLFVMPNVLHDALIVYFLDNETTCRV